MSLYEVTSHSKSKRAVVLGDTLEMIISESIVELSLQPGDYKVKRYIFPLSLDVLN